MKLYLAHKASEEDKNELSQEMKRVVGKLDDLGIGWYCTFLDENIREKTRKDYIGNTIETIKGVDGTLAIIKSEEKNEGLLIEVGLIVGMQKKLFLPIRKGVMKGRYVRLLADKIIEFNGIDDLVNKSGGIK